jgi:hypothetical protein
VSAHEIERADGSLHANVFAHGVAGANDVVGERDVPPERKLR